MRAAALGTSISLLLAGCGATGRGLADDEVQFKAPAIKAAVTGGQKSAAPQLVAALDDDDAAVRFYAIQGLRRLTGQTFDYHYYDDPEARRPAIARWQQWVVKQPEEQPSEGNRP